LNPFIWLSGANEDIIDSCGKLSHDERVKFTGFGTTVIIPALFGGIASGYAVSTFISNPFVYFLGGLLWFFTILAIDRFVVSTLYKSKLQSAASFYFALVIRLILAVVLGFIISHPLVLFIFNDSITEKINKDYIAQYQTQSNSVKELIENKTKDDVELRAEKEDELQCVHTLQSLEAAGGGIKPATSPKGKNCGYSSGKATCGYKCEKIYGKRIESINNKIVELDTRITATKEEYKEQQSRVETQYKKPPAADYLVRTEVLEKLTEKSSHVKWANRLLIAALVLIDSLLVILKASTPRGAYENEKDVLFNLLEKRGDSQRSAADIHYTTAGQAMFASKMKLYDAKEEMNTIMDAPTDFLESENKRLRKFERTLHSLGKLRPDEFKIIMRDLYTGAFQKSASIIAKFLKS
jgi:hypothetical protein